MKKHVGLLVLLLVHLLLLIYGSICHSPLVDEVAHLPAGVSHWHLLKFSSYRANPPLVRLVGAAPLLALNPEVNWRHLNDAPGIWPEFDVAADFFAANGSSRTMLFLQVARMACASFSLVGAVVCFKWANALFGRSGGQLAAFLWCFCPLVLAFGQTIMPDVGAAAMGALAAFSFRKWLILPRWSNVILVGITLGLALLTKFTWLVLLPLWPVCWVLWRLTDASRVPLSFLLAELAQLSSTFLIALWIVNVGYAFEGTGTCLGEYKFVSSALSGADAPDVEEDEKVLGNRFARGCLANVPIPAPAQYVYGLDLQKREFERGWYSYLNGEWRQRGWWYYYCYALLLKLPLGLLSLILISLYLKLFGGRFRSTATKREDLFLFAHAASVFLLISSQSGISHHTRLVLPIMPFIFIWLGRLPTMCGNRLTKTLMVVSTVWSASSSIWCFPHSLSYFNELAVGPRRGHEYLLGSNLDWGQDLLYLRAWIGAHPECGNMGLAYYGRIDPSWLGVQYELPPSNPRLSEFQGTYLLPGWYAVSANFVFGDYAPVFDGHGRQLNVSGHMFTYFQKFTPVAQAGYSIYIYHISPTDAAAANLRFVPDEEGLSPR